MVDPQEDRQRHAKSSLKLLSTENRGKAVVAKIVAKDALEAKLKISWPIGQPTGHGAPVLFLTQFWIENTPLEDCVLGSHRRKQLKTDQRRR